MQLALEGLVMIGVLLSLGSCVSQVPVPSAELTQRVLTQPVELEPAIYLPGFPDLQAQPQT